MSNDKIPYRHSPFDEELYDAMTVFNKSRPSKEHFSLVDARIISLIHSYDYSDTLFFASNEYLAEKTRSTAATVQKSINKLYLYNLIDKKVYCVGGRKQRVLTYNEAAAQKFKADPENVKPRDKKA